MDPCRAWAELFLGKDRGKIYDHFIRERHILINHLKNCVGCTNLLIPIDNDLSENADGVKLLNNTQFAQLIRELYQKSQGTRQIIVS